MTINGWRAKIGYLKPTYHGNDLEFWTKTSPEGVTFSPGIIGYVGTTEQEFREGLVRAEGIAASLAERDCSAIVVVGTPPFRLMGPDEEKRWSDRLAEQVGLPVVTAMRPHALALQSMGVRRLLTITYYGDRLNSAIKSYFSEFGIETVATDAFTAPSASYHEVSSELQTSSHEDLSKVDFHDVYRHVKESYLMLQENVDAVYINGTGWNVEPAIRYLESDLELPVICAVHCVSWLTYRKLRIDNRQGVDSHIFRVWPEDPDESSMLAASDQPRG